MRITVLILAVGIPAAIAQPAPDVITFEDALRRAVAANVDVESARLDHKSAAIDVSEERTNHWPTLNFRTGASGSLGRTFNQEEGQIVNQTVGGVSFGLSSGLDLFPALFFGGETQQARYGEVAAEHDVAHAEQEALAAVTLGFQELLQARSQHELALDNLARQETLLEDVDLGVALGALSTSDLYRQQSAAAGARTALVSAEKAVRDTELALVELLRLDPAVDYDFQADLEEVLSDPTGGTDADSLVALALANRPDVQAASSRVAASEEGVRIARRGFFPSVTLNAGYNTSANTLPDLSFLDQVDRNRYGNIGISLSLPIAWGENNRRVERARLAQEQAELAERQLEEAVRYEIARRVEELRFTREELEALRVEEAAAETAMEARREGFDLGVTPLDELLNAQDAYTTVASAVIQKQFETAFLVLLLRFYTGEGPQIPQMDGE